MDNQNPLSNSLKIQQIKDKNFHIAEKKKFLRYLLLNTATCSMVCKATGILQKNATRHKKALQDAGLLAQLNKDTCQVTGHKAFYLTCNPELFKAPTQLNINY